MNTGNAVGLKSINKTGSNNMFKKLMALFALMFSFYLAGCASVPMASVEDDNLRKKFNPPAKNSSALYIYRNSNFGGALKKTVYVDGEMIGETAPMTYFYTLVKPGEHTLSTESEFSPNDLKIKTEGGKNYFIQQQIKMGVFVGGAKLELVPEDKGKKGVLECKLAK
jgi:hypothetical protein